MTRALLLLDSEYLYMYTGRCSVLCLLSRRWSTYPELDHEGVHDAADHRDEVENVPGVFEEVLATGTGKTELD